MDSSFAITGKGYVIVAADMTAARSIVKMQSNEDKIKILGSHLLMAFSGEPGKLFSVALSVSCVSSLPAACVWSLFV
jgi:20S proteasome subunit beta 4